MRELLGEAKVFKAREKFHREEMVEGKFWKE